VTNQAEIAQMLGGDKRTAANHRLLRRIDSPTEAAIAAMPDSASFRIDGPPAFLVRSA
jgi:hypothetical protein